MVASQNNSDIHHPYLVFLGGSPQHPSNGFSTATNAWTTAEGPSIMLWRRRRAPTWGISSCLWARIVER